MTTLFIDVTPQHISGITKWLHDIWIHEADDPAFAEVEFTVWMERIKHEAVRDYRRQVGHRANEGVVHFHGPSLADACTTVHSGVR